MIHTPTKTPWSHASVAESGGSAWAVEVTDGVFRNVLSDDYRPPALPVVAAKLVRLANDERTTLDRVCAVVEEDPILATRILRIAQSAIYTRRGELHSIQQAVVRLGTEQVRDIVLEDVLNMHIFRCRDYQPIMERLRLHSVATAHVARRLAAEVDMPGQDVFLCGLLHDIGIAIALLALSEQPAPRPTFEQVSDALHREHPKLSSALATMWQLPGDVHAVVASHHDISARGFPDRLPAAICLSEALVNERGLSIAPEAEPAFDRSSPFQVAQARVELGVDDALWARLGELADEVIAELLEDGGARGAA